MCRLDLLERFEMNTFRLGQAAGPAGWTAGLHEARP
jgi:hypothetical protein